MSPQSLGTDLITGVSSGIGAAYALRLALRGHNLILVAGNRARPDAVAGRVSDATARSLNVVSADLTKTADLPGKGEP